MAEAVEFGGFYKSDVRLKPGERIFTDFSFLVGGCFGCLQYFCCPPCSSRCRKTLANMKKTERATEVQIMDARKKEREEGLSKRDFFDRYGFVLMEHQTRMTAESWLVKTVAPMKVVARSSPGKETQAEASPVKEIYAKEIEPLIRELIPNSSLVEYSHYALRRGPGGPNNFYGTGVHQDYGLYPEDMKTTRLDQGERTQEEWERKLDAEDSAGYSLINFWRPVLPMQGPVTAVPLAVCDPNTVSVDEIVPQDMYGFVPGGQHNMGVKFNANQAWYYYPNMTKDEVMIFRQFHYDKGEKAPYQRIKTVFHTAFKHPGAAKDAEVRCSSEYRVGVWLKPS